MRIDGVLLLDKPFGLSSNVAVQRVRRLFDRAKAGHTGTLDPLATGLLPVCLGEATKFSHTLLDADKAYEAVIRFGFVSSTGDAEGEIQPLREPRFGISDLQRVMEAFTGTISQIPPMHSALKKDGRPLYEYARAGEEVERKTRSVLIKQLQLYDIKNEYVSIKVLCSKGTYVRVLAQDMGAFLGCGGYLAGLRRIGVGNMSVSNAIGLEALEALDPAQRQQCLLPVDCLLASLPAIYLEPDASQRVRNGLEAEAAAGSYVGPVRLYGPTGGFLGLGEYGGEGRVSPKRMLSTGVQA
jgi:tRNA pseudouridine55 synthase